MLVILFTLCICINAKGASQAEYLQVQAGFIYNFTKFITWENPEPTTEYTIAIYSNTGLLPVIEKELAGKKVGEQNIKILSLTTPDVPNGTKIAVLDSDDAADTDRFIANANKASAVTVSRYNRMTQRGVCINFYIQEKKVRFEANRSCIDNKPYKISSQLLKLAKIR